jgi:hypothetical protein
MTVMQGIETEPVIDESDYEEEHHLFCCNEDIALCGEYIGDAEVAEFDWKDQVLCLFCRYIVAEKLPCPLCHSNMWKDLPFGS